MIVGKRRCRAAAVLFALGAVLAGCAGPGTVVDRGRCKTSECIYVRQDSDHKVAFDLVSVGRFPACVEGARWPDCQKGS